MREFENRSLQNFQTWQFTSFSLRKQVYSQTGLLCRSSHEVLTKMAARLLEVRRRLPVAFFFPIYLKRRIFANICFQISLSQINFDFGTNFLVRKR